MSERASGGLTVSLFGSDLFVCDGEAIHLGLKGTTLELLYLLVINHGNSVRREAICEMLWGPSNHDRQRSSLNSAVWRIAKRLPAHPGLVLRSTDTCLNLTIDDSIDIDTRTIERCVAAATSPGGACEEIMAKLEKCLASTNLGAFDNVGGEWALAEREHWNSVRFRGLSALMHWHGSRRNYESALQVGRRIIAEDPYRETVQIDVMWLYVLNGQRAQAIRQYESYAKILRRELSIEPMLETRALYDYIRNESPTATRSPDGDSQFNSSIQSGLAAIESSRRAFYDMLRAAHL